MKYPAINKQPHRRLTVPNLSGGINLRDGVSGILDNQACECTNMWYFNNLLQTRPTLKADVSRKTTIMRYSDEIVHHKEHKEVKHYSGAEKYILCSSISSYELAQGYDNIIHFWWQGATDTVALGYINFQSVNEATYFVAEKDGVIYCYTNAPSIFVKSGNAVWRSITNNEIYAPLVAINCQTAGMYESVEGVLGKAVQLESYNLIGNRYRMIYSTVNKSLLTESETQHDMAYALLESINNCAGQTITAEITNKNGNTVTHSITLTNTTSWQKESALRSDGLCMWVKDRMVWFFTSLSDDNAVKRVSASDFVDNNLTITAPYYKQQNLDSKVMNMTQAIWFGGTSQGINGGTRLFLGGNTTNGSLMLWSDLNNPLYFPENNYSNVGRNPDKIVAFGKQDEMLVIFKEHETYFSYYKQSDNITAESLVNQTTVDYEASSVYFPLVLLNSTIGCDVPDSVQLCRNRLVWANTDGAIYTLTSANQFSERSIYKVSAMVEKELHIPAYATSADWNGHYCLMCDKVMWLLNYESYGYQYIYSYTKTEDASLKMPWFKWEFPFIDVRYRGTMQTSARIFTSGNGLILNVFNNTDSSQNVNISSYSMSVENRGIGDEIIVENETNGNLIKDIYKFESSVKTKLYDFGSSNYRKNVDLINISLGNNNGTPISVTLITDVGTEEEEIVPYGAENDTDSSEYINNYNLTPCIRSVCRFGIGFNSFGVLAIDNLVFQFRLLGGAK